MSSKAGLFVSFLASGQGLEGDIQHSCKGHKAKASSPPVHVVSNEMLAGALATSSEPRWPVESPMGRDSWSSSAMRLDQVLLGSPPAHEACLALLSLKAFGRCVHSLKPEGPGCVNEYGLLIAKEWGFGALLRLAKAPSRKLRLPRRNSVRKQWCRSFEKTVQHLAFHALARTSTADRSRRLLGNALQQASCLALVEMKLAAVMTARILSVLLLATSVQQSQTDKK